MKILERKTNTELVAIAKCSHCTSTIEVEKSECSKQWDNGRSFFQTNEKCPVCQKQHLFLLECDFKHGKS